MEDFFQDDYNCHDNSRLVDAVSIESISNDFTQQ